jgi:hypothetical protein
MNSKRETNSELNYSDDINQENTLRETFEDLHDLNDTKKVIKHHMSERQLPFFKQRKRKSIYNINIRVEIEETKNKIMKNLETIKHFGIDGNNDEDNEKNKFNIFQYIDERRAIKERISLYTNHLDSDVARLIEYLSLDPMKRTKSEHKYIKQYLTKTTLMQSLLNLNENKKNITKIINKICLNLKYKFLFAGKTIYEINEIPDNYYYLIEGKVQAFKPEKLLMRMTGFEYFTYVMRLKRDNEHYLIDLILKNQTSYLI